jgi:hypothetical protein
LGHVSVQAVWLRQVEIFDGRGGLLPAWNPTAVTDKRIRLVAELGELGFSSRAVWINSD